MELMSSCHLEEIEERTAVGRNELHIKTVCVQHLSLTFSLNVNGDMMMNIVN